MPGQRILLVPILMVLLTVGVDAAEFVSGRNFK
jgi:hypothetical protein